MSEIIRWLTHDDQKELYGKVFAIVLNVVFLALILLLLWPLDRTMLAFRLAKGYLLFWIIVSVTAFVLIYIHKLFRVNMYDHPDVYVISNLAVSGLVLLGWSAFAALVVGSFAAATMPVWIVMILYLAGILSCFIAFNIVSSFYQGQAYRIINLPLSFVSFIIFSIWPTIARLTYGKFFDLF